MAVITEVFSAFNITELLRVLWMEVALACVAATVYFTLTGWISLPAKKRNAAPEQGGKGVRKNMGKPVEQEPTAHQLVAKALRQGKISNAVALLKELPESCDSFLPANLAPRLLMAVAKASNFDEAIVEVGVFAGKIETRSLESAVNEAAKYKDVAACRQLQEISRRMSITKSHQVLEALAKAVSSDVDFLRSLVDDAQAPLAKPFAKAVLLSCAALKDVDLAFEVFEKVAESDAEILRDDVEKAATEGASAPKSHAMKAAAASIRECGKNGDLKAAIQIFEEQRGQFKDSLLYNSLIDACVEGGKFEQAMEYFSEAQSTGFADVVSYNLAMKGYLSQGKVAAAKSLLAQFSEKGLVPTLASYHGLLAFHVNARNLTSAWAVVHDMQAAGVSPSAVTCTILLKGKFSSAADVNKVLSLVDSVGPMDEVLFCSVSDACIRTGQLELLTRYQTKLMQTAGSSSLTAPTYGSMIKAYGQMWDVKKVWELWEEMKSHDVQPTAITFGCMVEALVANYCTADAWKLVQEMRNNESTQPLVNTVIYSTILKGFSFSKETNKVMSLYEEMKEAKVTANTITYNTILNAFAEGGAMQRVPSLLEDMKKAVPPVEPDLVTYSTIVKGYCSNGNFDCAMNILKDMQSDAKFSPDEVMYNSLMEGCVKEHRAQEALKLLDDMKSSHVTPSNYTLSILVKLLGRCRRLNQAFTIVQEISRDYGVKVNIQVYTCLIQACFNNRNAGKAVTLYEQLIEEGLVPDEMLYSSLVRGCAQAGLVDKAVELARSAHGLTAATSRGRCPGISTRCRDELVAALSQAQGKSLLAELAAAPAAGGKGKGKGKDSGKSSGTVRAPWRQQ